MRIEWASRRDSELYEDERLGVRRLNVAAATKLRRVVDDLREADTWNDFAHNAKYKLERLRENRHGVRSVRLTKGHRIYFELKDAKTVRILQVGGHYG